MQVLKIIRYTSKLVLAGALSDPSSELAVRLKALESSIGTSRYSQGRTAALSVQSPYAFLQYNLAQVAAWHFSLKPCAMQKSITKHSFLTTCRKAYRLGKWLADVNTIRKTPLTTRFGYLEIMASAGEGVYYFVEQLTWYATSQVHFAPLSVQILQDAFMFHSCKDRGARMLPRQFCMACMSPHGILKVL